VEFGKASAELSTNLNGSVDARIVDDEHLDGDRRREQDLVQ
jgi:hypothetical protein